MNKTFRALTRNDKKRFGQLALELVKEDVARGAFPTVAAASARLGLPQSALYDMAKRGHLGEKAFNAISAMYPVIHERLKQGPPKEPRGLPKELEVPLKEGRKSPRVVEEVNRLVSGLQAFASLADFPKDVPSNFSVNVNSDGTVLVNYYVCGQLVLETTGPSPSAALEGFSESVRNHLCSELHVIKARIALIREAAKVFDLDVPTT